MSWPQQRFDGPALVHGAVAFSHLIERKRQVEDPAGVDLTVPHEVDKFWEVAPHRRGTAVEMDVGEE